MQIKVSQEEYEKCVEFSENVNTSLYAQRNQHNADKRKKDAKIGKLGELVAFHFLKDKYEVSYPDFKIYSIKEKSWDFDIKSQDFNLHVKTQDVLQSQRYGESWLFQYGAGKVRHYDKEIFDRVTPYQYVCFTVWDDKAKYGLVKGIVSLDDLHDNKLFSLPVLPQLQKANKLAVYFKDLESNNINLQAL
jgi:hypothetical protein